MHKKITKIKGGKNKIAKVTKQLVTTRLKPKTIKKIDEIAGKREESKSEVIRNIIEKYFELQEI